MAAPTYMRSLSTFSAPHHSPSAWASTANSAAVRVQYYHTASINTHNTHIYTHHLQSFNSYAERPKPLHYQHHPAAVPGGRRRSSSIRSRAPPPFIKFDPFADEPMTEKSPVVPTEIQRYPSPSPRRLSVSAAPFVSVSASAPVSRVSSPVPLSPILASRPLPRSSPSPPPLPSRQPLPSGPGALGGPNVSKLVAGIMLNRMSVGKPIRRRVSGVPAVSPLSLGSGTVEIPKKREYVKSCLSSVVSVEA